MDDATIPLPSLFFFKEDNSRILKNFICSIQLSENAIFSESFKLVRISDDSLVLI